MPPAFFIEIMLKNCIRALTWVNCRTRPPSCAPALRWRQGQALRVLRNLYTAGRGRMIENAGSGGMRFRLTKGIKRDNRHLILLVFIG